MSKPEILVIGSFNMDMVARVQRVPRPGETVLAHDFLSVPGGKGANQAVSAARAGGAVTLVARVGHDPFGDRAMAGFGRDRIRAGYIVRDRKRPSGVAMICVADRGQNSITVAPGANGHLSPTDVRRAERAFGRADRLLLQLETPLRTVEASIRLANKYRLPVILNPAPVQPLSSPLLQQVAVLTPNQVEAESLTGIRIRSDRSAARAAERLRSQGVRTVVITMGARGVFVADEQGHARMPAFRVAVVDTTAAGDVFNGALAVALSEGHTLPAAAQFAQAAAALSVSRVGAQPSAPTRLEMSRFLKRRNLSIEGPRSASTDQSHRCAE